MTNLSPAAQAVLAAAYAYDYRDEEISIPEILRAAADQFFTDWDGMCCAEHLKSIAAELEGHEA